ncbi:sensor histidine kinase [Nocardia inohanensis]|uniref:sensor histidine kinase n=1 Tax=Nocardia inohanensis TaxID=209246 RepID=UPI00082DD5D5|nr:nitrate- and nitrite sensing domain-containing protein [Nocardia inohanensis]
MLRPRLGVRTRILAIALVPSLALVVVGISATGVLVDHSSAARTWADELRDGIGPTREMITAVQLERRITLWRSAGMDTDLRELTKARARVDDALRALAPAQNRLSDLGPQSMKESSQALGGLGRQLATIRAGVDAGTLPMIDAYQFYSGMPELVLAGVRIAEQTAPDAATAAELTEAEQVLRSLEAASRVTALGATLVNGEELPPALATEYVRLAGYYRLQIEQTVADSDAEQAATAKQLVSGAPWLQLGAMEAALVQRTLPRNNGTRTSALPLTVAEWSAAATTVDQGLADLWQAQNTEAQRLAADAASDTTRKSLLAAAGMLVVALGAIGVALVLANRIIRRLKRLRDRTLALADEQLPETMRRLAAGEPVEDEIQAPALDFGGDEIGQVASAFGHAQAAAVAAAVTEARTREGVRAVFLNIAHRSQVVVHRQLELLDEAESSQEDPALLETFFRLDHLATRERRNAENLVILAGGRPGRQWRNPVPLLDVIRSAVGETIEYTRVRTGRVPAVFVLGPAVGDLIHLLAELIDNAASFSPPQSRVEITGNTVGRGVAIEITDQGMGIPESDLAAINTRLADPADFGITTLSHDSRLGVFVVSQLAARHGISIRLAESDYGGIRAVVLIPAPFLAQASDPEPATGLPALRRADLDSTAPPDPGRGLAALPEDRFPWLAAATGGSARGGDQPGVTSAFRHNAPPDWTRRPDAAPDRDERRESKPALPRRQRQASLAPELANDPGAADAASPERGPAPERSADQARDLFSAIENGTRRGRQSDPGAEGAPGGWTGGLG